uniref:CCamK n=1 Tax=Arundo donax TaxID=35708 RepID=A0A0A9BTC5_ARUDO
MQPDRSASYIWKQRRRASSPREFLRLESPHRISLMSTVPSRLLSNKSNTRGARGISESIFIAFSTSSNSDSVAFSPSPHIRAK